MGSSPEDPAFEESIDLLDQEIAVTEDLIEKRNGDIEDTLNLVEDIIERTVLRLHFLCGLSWKEAGYYTNLTESAAKTNALRAMQKHIPK